MGVVTARLVFLAFLGLTGTIIYNALYLQGHDPPVVSAAPRGTGDPEATISVNPTPPPASTDLPALDAGQGGSHLIVRAVQRELAERGFDVGEVDGTLSDKTRAAISSYESSQGLPVTGLPTDDLLRQILLGDSLGKLGTTGSLTVEDSDAAEGEPSTVRSVQKALADLGYDPGPIDGAMGDKTARAISTFQSDRKIAATGQVTPELLDELKRVTGRDVTMTAAKP
ncbi:MAG: peptidoglycan-binding domain-containing protein [Methyloceanibacter sp.]